MLLLERSDERRQLALIEAGADLIFIRPYSPRLLVAQMRALMRRSSGLPYFSLPALSQAGVTLDPSSPRYILTEAGIGYFFEPEPDQQRLFSKTETQFT